MKRTAQEIRTLKKELTKTRQLEHKVLAKESREPRGLGLTGKIREKIPEKAMASLEVAFEKGFTLIFTKGDGLIDKMGIEKARRQYEIYAASLEKMIYEETLKAIDKTAGSRTAVTKGISTAEGSGLGIFGIGLPDIPIFLAMLLKASYEIAAGYGIDFRDEREKRYTLALFNTIFAAGQDKMAFSDECDAIGDAIDHGESFDTQIYQEDIELVSNTLATDMLVAKFLQGFTFAGVIGGPINLHMVHKVSKIARIKYKKRFLNRLLIASYDEHII